MKKKVLLLGICAVAIGFASCDSKLCYCYTNTIPVQEMEVYTSTDSPCSALNNSSRACVEREERMDPSDIARVPNQL